MTRFTIDTDRTELDVKVHPSLFGFRLHITGLTGAVDGTVLADGTIDLGSAIGAQVSMNINELDLGSPLLTRTTHGALGLAGDGSVSGRLLEVEADQDHPDGLAAGSGSVGNTYRFSFEVESGMLRGRLEARCQIAIGEDGSATATGLTEFRASDFDVHLPGLDHLRGICEWTVVIVPGS